MYSQIPCVCVQQFVLAEDARVLVDNTLKSETLLSFQCSLTQLTALNGTLLAKFSSNHPLPAEAQQQLFVYSIQINRFTQFGYIS